MRTHLVCHRRQSSLHPQHSPCSTVRSFWYPRCHMLRSAMVCPAPGTTGPTLLSHTKVLQKNIKVCACQIYSHDNHYLHIRQHFSLSLSLSPSISRELKRLSTVTLSPVYAHFSETLAGLSTIRAMRASRRFMAENEERLTVNQRANFGSTSTCVCV